MPTELSALVTRIRETRRAIAYLIRMLDDPDEQGPTFSTPGESLRAAQALCDIYLWPFEWDKSYVAKTAARVAKCEEL